MPRYQPRKASRGGYVCPSCRVQEDIWSRMFGVVSLSFPNVGQERWGLRCDAHGKLLGFSKGPTDCRFLESCSYKGGWTTMDKGLWAEPLYTCWYLFLLISTEGWRDAHLYFQYASFSGGNTQNRFIHQGFTWGKSGLIFIANHTTFLQRDTSFCKKRS